MEKQTLMFIVLPIYNFAQKQVTFVPVKQKLPQQSVVQTKLPPSYQDHLGKLQNQKSNNNSNQQTRLLQQTTLQPR